MKRQPVFERWFKCPKCSALLSAYKSAAKKTAAGHIKTMWCPWCKKERDFIQIKYH